MTLNEVDVVGALRNINDGVFSLSLCSSDKEVKVAVPLLKSMIEQVNKYQKTTNLGKTKIKVFSELIKFLEAEKETF